jgi:hypothetical protein
MKRKKKIKKIDKESTTLGDIIARIVWWNPWLLFIIIICLIASFS